MSASDVLVRIRLLLTDRLSSPPTRGDNQKLSVAIWDLHNVMPTNNELFNIWHALSSSKRDSARFEQGVSRLTNFLQSSAITGIAPALGTAAAFYNRSVNHDTTGNGNPVIRSGVPFVAPPPPPPVTPHASAYNQPSALTVERIPSAPLYDNNHTSPNVSNRRPSQPIEIPQSDFTVAVTAPEQDLDSFADDAPPGYTFAAEAESPPPPAPPPPPPFPPPAPPALPEEGSLPPRQNSLSNYGASPSQARPPVAQAAGSGSLSSKRLSYAPAAPSPAHGVAQIPPQPPASQPTHALTTSAPGYTPYEPSPTTSASSPMYNPQSATVAGGSTWPSSNTAGVSLNQQTSPLQPLNSSQPVRPNVTGAGTEGPSPYPPGGQSNISPSNQSWRPSHSSTPSIPAYSQVEPAPLSSPRAPATTGNVPPANAQPPPSAGSAALYQQQPPTNPPPVPTAAYSDVSVSPESTASRPSNQRRPQPVNVLPSPTTRNYSTVAQYDNMRGGTGGAVLPSSGDWPNISSGASNVYPSPATSPVASRIAVTSPTTQSLPSTESSLATPASGTPNAQYSWSTAGGAGQPHPPPNQYTGGGGQQRPYQTPQYHPGTFGPSETSSAASSRPPIVHSGTPPPQQPTPVPIGPYPSPPPSASAPSYGQPSLAAYNQVSGRPLAHHANTVPSPAPPNAAANPQSASWGNQDGPTSRPVQTATSGPPTSQYGGSFPPSPGVPGPQQHFTLQQGATPYYGGQPAAAQPPQTATPSRPMIHHANTAPLPPHSSAQYATQNSFGQVNQGMQQQPQMSAQTSYTAAQFYPGNGVSGQAQPPATQMYTAVPPNNGVGRPNGYIPTNYNSQQRQPPSARGPRSHAHTVPSSNQSAAQRPPAGQMLGTLGNLAGQALGRIAASHTQSSHAAPAHGNSGRPPQGQPTQPQQPHGQNTLGTLASALGNAYRAYNSHQHHHQPQNNNSGGGGGGGGSGSIDPNSYFSNSNDNSNSDPSGDTFSQWTTTSGDPSGAFDMTQMTTSLDNGDVTDTWTNTVTDTYTPDGGLMETFTSTFTETPDGGDGGSNVVDVFSGVGDMITGGDNSGVGDFVSGWFNNNN